MVVVVVPGECSLDGSAVGALSLRVWKRTFGDYLCVNFTVWLLFLIATLSVCWKELKALLSAREDHLLVKLLIHKLPAERMTIMLPVSRLSDATVDHHAWANWCTRPWQPVMAIQCHSRLFLKRHNIQDSRMLKVYCRHAHYVLNCHILKKTCSLQ